MSSQEDIAKESRPYRFARVPSEDLAPILFVHGDMPVELDGVAHVQPLDLPRVAKVEPVVWLLMLEPIHNGLHTTLRNVTDASSAAAFSMSGGSRPQSRDAAAHHSVSATDRSPECVKKYWHSASMRTSSLQAISSEAFTGHGSAPAGPCLVASPKPKAYRLRGGPAQCVVS